MRHSLPRFAFAASLAGLLGFSLTACDRGGEVTDYPPPGEMRVVSVTPLGASLNTNWSLDFEEWYAGAPTPSTEQLILPETSSISRATSNVAEGRTACRQKWSSPDARWKPAGRFGVVLPHLEKFHEYQLTFQALSPGDFPIFFELFSAQQEGDSKPEFFALPQPPLEIPKEKEWKEYTITFATGLCTEVYLLTGCYDLPEESKTSFLLDDLQLRLVGEAPDRKPANPPENNLLPNGSFEHWVPGRPAPAHGYFLPSPVSSIYAVSEDTVDGLALLQLWRGPDVSKPPEIRFGMQADGLNKGTEYEFRGKANTFNAGRAFLEVYGVGTDGKLEALSGARTAVDSQEGWQDVIAAFDTGDYARVRIVTRAPGKDVDYPNRVLWDSWSIVLAKEK